MENEIQKKFKENRPEDVIWDKPSNDESTKIFILNAPPRAGKDSLAEYLHKELGASKFSFKDKLFAIAFVTGNFTRDEWLNVWIPRYNTDAKDKPWDRIGGISQRDYLIKISEEWIKPHYGNDYFGNCLVNNINNQRCDIAVVSDGGFVDEIEPLFNKYGKENVYIVQWSKKGCSFENDSRDYIDDYPDNIIKVGENVQDHFDVFAEKAKNKLSMYANYG